MPPKTSATAAATNSNTKKASASTDAASAKLASIPHRPKDLVKLSHSVSTSHSGGGGGGRPNKVAYTAEQDRLRREIDTLQAKLAALRVQIGDPKTGGGAGPLMERRKKLRDELDALRNEQSTGKNSRTKIMDQIRMSNEGVQRKIKELNAARGKMPYKSVAEVDAKIRQLEAQIESGTMRIVEEKKAIAEIQNLRKARKLVDSYEPQQEFIEHEKNKIEHLRKELDGPDMKSTSDRWNQIKLELDQINTQLNQSSKSRDKLFEDRNSLQDRLNEVYEQKRQSAQRYKEANDKYFTKMQEDQKRRIEKEKADREAAEAAEMSELHADMRERAAAPAFEREMEDCRTLILYFDKLLGNAPAEQVEVTPKDGTAEGLPKLKELRKVTADDGFEGMVPIKKKGDEEEEFFVGGGKKGKKNKRQNNVDSPSSNNAKQALHFPLSTLNALHTLSIAVPATKEDIPAAIAALSEKKKWFAANEAEVTQTRIQETEAKIAEAQAQAAVAEKGKVEGQSPTAEVS